MRAVIQRALEGQVTVDNKVIGQIGRGLVILVGIGKGDSDKDIEYIADKVVNLRIFQDEADKMNLSVLDIQGEILAVSQFTLYGDARKGRRPSFSEAALPDQGLDMFDRVVERIRAAGLKVKTGEFGADMKVEIINDGPCTIILDSQRGI
ncbi:MAG: D-aminoacyl-tRNA deacylase [Ignavibacteriales bacterium]